MVSAWVFCASSRQKVIWKFIKKKFIFLKTCTFGQFYGDNFNFLKAQFLKRKFSFYTKRCLVSSVQKPSLFSALEMFIIKINIHNIFFASQSRAAYASCCVSKMDRFCIQESSEKKVSSTKYINFECFYKKLRVIEFSHSDEIRTNTR